MKRSTGKSLVKPYPPSSCTASVVIDIAEYRHLKGETSDFKDYLRSGPGFDDLDLDRAGELPRSIDWAGEA